VVPMVGVIDVSKVTELIKMRPANMFDLDDLEAMRMNWDRPSQPSLTMPETAFRLPVPLSWPAAATSKTRERPALLDGNSNVKALLLG